MFRKASVFLIFLLVFLTRSNENEDNNDVFVATREWQTVKKGQKIPKGLHVRINLETGETEAKLLDEEESPADKTKAVSAVPQEQPYENDDSKSIPKPTPEEAIKNIENDDVDAREGAKGIKDKFRSYDEIKKSLGELNLTPKMDSEIIADLLERHREVLEADKLDTAEVLKILEDLDFLAHQYDNAREFVKQNGFKGLIYKNLNSSKAVVKRETLKLLTALLQNNVDPKIHALETGSVGTLLRLINLDSDVGVKHRALTALGALLRSFPAAQRNFVDSGGLSVLSKYFDSDNIKIQIKLVTVISDLVVEHTNAVSDEKLNRYYADFDLTKKIIEHDWCKKFNKLLLGLLITDKDDHDSIEKCLTAMHSLRGHCGDSYEQELLVGLKERYRKLSLEDNSDSNFFSLMKGLCDEILRYVHKTSVKTEL